MVSLSLRQAGWGIVLFVAAIFLVTAALRFSALHLTYTHPDEPIAIGVVSGILKSGSLDTNWALYDVGMHRRPQYNFSSYLLMLAGLGLTYSKLVGALPDLQFLRAVSMAAGALLVPLIFILGRWIYGRTAGLLAAALTAVSPQLFQDSLYARPESIFTLLFLTALVISVAPLSRPELRLCVSSFIMGVLVATKISALTVAPLPLLIFWLQEGRVRWSPAFSCALGGALGFVAGVPYIVKNYDAYWQGIAHLLNAYHGVNLGGPTGLRHASLWDRIVYMAGFVFPTLGPAAILLFVWGSIFAAVRRNFIALALAVLALANLVYFGTMPKFIERNFSHVLPLLFLIAAGGFADLTARIRPQGVRALAAFSVLVVAVWPAASLVYTMRFYVLSGGYDTYIESVRNDVRRQYPGPYMVWPNLVYGQNLMGYINAHMASISAPLNIEFLHYDDRFSEKTLQEFLATYPATLITRIDSPFKHISPSTMEAYLAPSHPIYRIEGKLAD